MKQTEEEMSDAENEIRRLQEAIAVKVCYSKVAQTRLENRLTRPNEEMCQDNVQFGLQDECKQLAATTQALHDKLRQQQSVFHTHTRAHTLGAASRRVVVMSVDNLPRPSMRCTTSCANSSQYSVGRRRGVVVSGVRRMNEVNARRARLVLGWVTVFGRVYHLCV